MALARNTDPHTSHEAAFMAEIHCETERRRREIKRLVERFPGHTSRELAKRVHWRRREALDRTEIARRLSELRERGDVVMGKSRKCNAGGRPGVTWYPVD